MSRKMEVEAKDLEAVVLCLALGTLEAMRSGSWPVEAGMWSLGRPVFWKPLVDAGLDESIITVLQSADELSLLEELGGRPAAEARLDRMIAEVRLRLSALAERSWYVRWSPSA